MSNGVKLALALWALVLTLLWLFLRVFTICLMVTWITGVDINFWVLLLSLLVTGTITYPIKKASVKLAEYAKKGG